MSDEQADEAMRLIVAALRKLRARPASTHSTWRARARHWARCIAVEGDAIETAHWPDHERNAA